MSEIRQSAVGDAWYICKISKKNPNIAMSKVRIEENIIKEMALDWVKKTLDEMDEKEMIEFKANGYTYSMQRQKDG